VTQAEPMQPIQPTPHQEITLAAAEAQYHQSMKAYSRLLDKGTPWLFEVGSWIFGGLIAFTLLILSALITVGPVDLYVKSATTALALALPLDVTGLVLLRLVQDLKPVKFEQGITQTFQEVGLTPGDMQIPSLTSLQALRIRGTRVALRYALGILALSVVLTLAGITVTLWHMAWWIGGAFLAMVAVNAVIVMVAMVAAQPPVSAQERAQRKAYRDELLRQAQEQKEQIKQAYRRH
jgi:hypothetical protein